MTRVLSVLVVVFTLALMVHDVSPSRAEDKQVTRNRVECKVRAQDDFAAWANAKWLESTALPPGHGRWGTWQEMRKRADEAVRAIVVEATSGLETASDPAEKKIGLFYKCAMNGERIEQRGTQPLADILDMIDGIRDPGDLLDVVAHLHLREIPSLFRFLVMPDFRDSTKRAFYVGQGGLGLPGKSFYFDDDERLVTIRTAYKEYLVRSFALLGLPEAEAKAAGEVAFSLELKLATASLSNSELRSSMPEGGTQLSELTKKSKHLKWNQYFEALGTSGLNEVVILTPAYFEVLDRLAGEVSLDAFKDYLRLCVLTATSPHLSSGFRESHFHFYGETLSGIDQPRPREELMLDETSKALGGLIGKTYLARHFVPATRDRVMKMVDVLRSTLNESLANMTWMSAEAKKVAQDKLAKMVFIIGPDLNQDDLEDFPVECGDHVQNVLRANRFRVTRNLASLSRPVSRQIFPFSPQQVFGGYNKLLNNIGFTAAFLQPPFFDPEADDATNLGLMGAAIGHELFHGFDDNGSRFDANGLMKEWWTAAERAEFQRRSANLVTQFNGYEMVDGLHIDGQFTLGENLADLAGLTLSFQAIKKVSSGKPDPLIDGNTREQRFFLAWAQLWRCKITDEELTRQVKTNEHAPARQRINGPLSNMPEFYEAFEVKPGNGMYLAPDKRTTIW